MKGTKGRIRLRRTLGWVLPLVFAACQASSGAPSPEQVVDQYVRLLHQGEIEQAKSLCTPAATAYLDALAAVIEAAQTPLDSSQLTIEAIKCEYSEDQASSRCEGIIDDGFERYTEVYLLSLQEGQWRIDHQPDTGTLQTTEEVLETEEEKEDE